MNTKTDIMIAGRSKDAIAELENALNGSDRDVRQRWISNGHSNPLAGISEWPDLLVFHLSTKGPEEIESLLENPQSSRPATIVIGPADNLECMKLALKAGVSDYIEEPYDLNQLNESINRVSETTLQKEAVSDSANREGVITALVSAKGGAGASFMAANLAHITRTEGNLNVALIDLDLQFGSLSQYLDIDCEHGLQSVLEVAEQLDAMAIDGYMSKHSSGLRLLSPNEQEIILQRDVSSSQFQALLRLLKKSYDCSFIDLPRQIDELSADVYEMADNIMIITQQEVASIRDASRLYRLIRDELSIPEDHFSLIVNRYDKDSVIELKDICNKIGIPKEFTITIPNSYQSVAESINMGVPIFDYAKSSRVTRALSKLNTRITGTGNDADKSPTVMRRVFTNLLRG